MIHQRDLVVVGGSFAGLACAQTAAEHGASVVLFDSKPDPSLRLHTTGLLVQEVMERWDPPKRCVGPGPRRIVRRWEIWQADSAIRETC